MTSVSGKRCGARSLKAIALVCGVTLLSGCTVARIYATSGNEIGLTEETKQRGEFFTIDQRITFDLTGAIDVQELLRQRFGSNHKFQNVTIKLRQDPVDILLNLVTLGLANSKTFEISGDKVN